MSTPPPGSISSTWEPPSDVVRDRSAIWPVMAIIFAVLSAVLAVLLFRAGAERPLTTSAEAAVTTACDVLAEIDPEATDMGESYQAEGFVTLQQLGLVNSLGWLAYAHDESYEDVRDGLMVPVDVVSQTFSSESAEAQAAIADAQQTCAGRDQR